MLGYSKYMSSCYKSLLILFLSVTLFTGCATILGGGSDEKLTVESSTPLRIKVVGSDGQVINKTTPFTIDMDRGQNYTVKVNSDKYESEDIFINRKMRTLSIFNLFFILGWAIDYATGNIWEHRLHHVFIDTKDLEMKKTLNLESFDTKFSIEITGKDDSKDLAKSRLSRRIHFIKTT